MEEFYKEILIIDSLRKLDEKQIEIQMELEENREHGKQKEKNEHKKMIMAYTQMK